MLLILQIVIIPAWWRIGKLNSLVASQLGEVLDSALQEFDLGHLHFLLPSHLSLMVKLFLDPERVQHLELFVDLGQLKGVLREGVFERFVRPNLVVLGRSELLEHHWEKGHV